MSVLTLPGSSGSGSGYQPGSPDTPPTSPNGADDEFTALTGWTTLGTLDTLNVTDILSHVHIKRVNGAVHADGIYKACPTIPFTVTCKLADMNLGTNYNHAGLAILEASPGKLWVWGPVYANAILMCINKWTNLAALSAASNFTEPEQIEYLRIIVTSSSNVDFQFSRNGYVWNTAFSAQNPGFTVGAVGLIIDDSSAAGTVEAAFDWIRFS